MSIWPCRDIVCPWLLQMPGRNTRYSAPRRISQEEHQLIWSGTVVTSLMQSERFLLFQACSTLAAALRCLLRVLLGHSALAQFLMLMLFSLSLSPHQRSTDNSAHERSITSKCVLNTITASQSVSSLIQSVS